jgi:membrane fusion protein, multidrug efflux system
MSKLKAVLLVFAGLHIQNAKAEAPEFAYKNPPAQEKAATGGLTEDKSGIPELFSDEQGKVSGGQLLRAQIKARESTLISSEMTGRIDQLKLRDGERFTQGQVLVGFNCVLEEAQLTKAKATLEKKRKTFDVNQKLGKLKSISTLELEVSKAEEAEAQADVGVAQATVSRCVVKAPFPGRVTEVAARAFQTVRQGDPLLEIINEKDLEIEFMAPSRALPQLNPGAVFKVVLDETARSYYAEIIRLGGKVDPVSQTIKVYGKITEDASDVMPGMSGAIELTPTQ